MPYCTGNSILKIVLFLLCVISIDIGKGSDPEWNESFVFTISNNVSELTIKLMDSDIGTEDDFVGEATWVFYQVIMIYTYYFVSQTFFEKIYMKI